MKGESLFRQVIDEKNTKYDTLYNNNEDQKSYILYILTSATYDVMRSADTITTFKEIIHSNIEEMIKLLNEFSKLKESDVSTLLSDLEYSTVKINGLYNIKIIQLMILNIIYLVGAATKMLGKEISTSLNCLEYSRSVISLYVYILYSILYRFNSFQRGSLISSIEIGEFVELLEQMNKVRSCETPKNYTKTSLRMLEYGTNISKLKDTGSIYYYVLSSALFTKHNENDEFTYLMQLLTGLTQQFIEKNEESLTKNKYIKYKIKYLKLIK